MTNNERVYWALRWKDELCWVGHHDWTPIKAARFQFETRKDAADERTRRIQKKNIVIVRVTVRRKPNVVTALETENQKLRADVDHYRQLVKELERSFSAAGETDDNH